MDIERIFNDLESNQTHECEEAKRKLVEFFTQSKEQYLIHNMMEYYLKTGSLRIMEVLVKVQSPHDSYIFDRLADWLKTQSHRVQALNLFCFVVRKHPTWLFKVEKHRLIRDIIKLLLTEKEIVPLMSALLCIITLLPIIPNLVPNFLNELFDVFGHLASWNSQNPNPLPGDKLVHLQLGLQMLFHRLYGMYPCNFLAYLSDFIKKEKGAIYHHTIKPLLETVRVHPMLVTATQESEVSNSRWKEMEPHDVVVECAKLSLPVVYQDLNAEHTYHLTSSDLWDTPGSTAAGGALTRSATHHSSGSFGGGMMRTMRANTTTGATSHHHFAAAAAAYKETQRVRGGVGHVTRFDVAHNNAGGGSHSAGHGVIWSPFNEITSSGPIPLTPTPSYVLPLTSSSASAANLSQQLLGLTGSSPPEAAVEATPETTPMKDVKVLKHSSLTNAGGGAGPSSVMANPHAVRAIFGTNQPASPMRKDVTAAAAVVASTATAPHNQFSFPDVAALTPATGTTTTVVEQELSTRLLTRVTTTYDRKLQQMIHDRTHSQSPFQLNEALTGKQAVGGGGFRSPMDTSTNCDTPEMDCSSTTHHVVAAHSAQTAATPTSILTSPQPTAATPTPTTSCTLEHITKVCLDCNETERSMCTAGGLHIPTSRSMQLLAKGIKRRNRMASYCYNDSSCEKISASGRKDVVATAAEAAKVRRTKSCSSICLAPSSTTSDDGTDDDCGAVASALAVISTFGAQQQLQSSDRRLQKSGKMLAIASTIGGGTTKAVVATAVAIPTQAVASQTVELPQNYENSLFAMLVENDEMRNSYERNQLYPHEILDQYILRTIRSKESFEVDHRLDKDQLKEQFQLLRLQLHYERYRREIHAERNRRLMGRSRDKRSLEMERDRLNEQLKKFAADNEKLEHQIDRTMKGANEREHTHTYELATLKAKYQHEVEQNKCLRQANENLQTRLSEELAQRKDLNYELESLRGQIFNMTSELEHAQLQAEIGAQCKQEMARLETEFIIMGEVQIKCRDRLAEIDNFRARDEELQMLQETFNKELNDLKPMLVEKSSHLDSAKHKILELQAQLVSNEKVITEQKRLLKTVKDEYEERFKSLNKKYEVQKTIITQMEEKIMMSITKPQAAITLNACSPDTDKTDIASSMDHNSPLSTSLASSESLSVSLRSTELRNLQQLVESPEVVSAGGSIIEGTRLPTLDLASSANSAAVITGASVPASAINIVQSTMTTSSSASGVAHNFDMTAGAATTSQHAHPHLHLQQQQQKR